MTFWHDIRLVPSFMDRVKLRIIYLSLIGINLESNYCIPHKITISKK